MAGLFREKPDGRRVFDICPIDAAALQEDSYRMNGREKFALFYGEGAHREVDGSALLQPQQSFEQRERILAARYTHGDAVAFANHLEATNGLAHLAQNGFL
jgi:hypothetical protein